MATNAQVTKQGFFRQAPLGSKNAHASKTPRAVSVGGGADSGFRAMAVAFIDYVSTHVRVKGDVVQRLLSRHFDYFPHHKPAAYGLITPQERMQQMMNNVRLSSLVPSLAYTLRQMAVDELCAHPVRYRNAFIKHHQKTSPKTMRDPSTWLDDSAMPALAEALSLSLDIQVVRGQSSLPVRLRYNEHADHPTLRLQLQDEQYFPLVRSAERFSDVKASAAFKHEVQLSSTNHNLDDFNAILKEIAQDDQRILTVLKATYHRLNVMVAAGELDKAGLIDLYLSAISSESRVKYVGTEYGSQDFFSCLSDPKQDDVPIVLEQKSHDQQVMDELIKGISRAISTEQISTEKVFAQLDQVPESRTGHAFR